MLPEASDPKEVARAIVRVVNLPFRTWPFHVTVDPADMGYEVMALMGDRIHRELFHRMGLGEILAPLPSA